MATSLADKINDILQDAVNGAMEEAEWREDELLGKIAKLELKVADLEEQLQAKER